MDSDFITGVGRKLTLAVVVAGALTGLATASHASYRGHASPRFIAAGYHHGGGYGGYRGYRVYRAPVRYYRAPRSYFSFGLSFGYPRYYAPRPVYVYSPPPVYVAPHPVYRERVYDDRVYEREERRDSDRDRDDRDYDREDDSSRRWDDVDVTNEPPGGTYYRDRFCNQNFSTLDDYTEHLQSKHHSQTIDIIERDSGQRVRTLEFVDGLWQAQP